MGQMREKLQEHILYLQREIRKRDELLEDASEVDYDESDSCISSKLVSTQSFPISNDDDNAGGPEPFS